MGHDSQSPVEAVVSYNLADSGRRHRDLSLEERTLNRTKRTTVGLVIGAFLVASLVWIAIDLYGPRSSSLRNFDADEVARLETDMWRSYYDRKQLLLFRQLSELLRTQYHLPPLRSQVMAFEAARAAFVFKRGRERSDYERALPNLVRYYTAIRRVSREPFDVERTARLELEWWIVHRERERHPPGDLDRALADLQAEVYRLPAEPFREHARLRAEAMTIRDRQAAAGGVGEEDWARIEELLRSSWRSLHEAVNSQTAGRS